MPDKIKVLHIIKSLGRGGAEMLLPETLRKHDQSRFEFHYIYFLPWKDQMASAILDQGGKVTCLKAKNNIQLILRWRSIVTYVREHRISIIHAHLPWAGIVSRVAGLWCGIPVLYTEHNKQERYHFLTRRMNLITMNLLTRVIAVSEDVALSIKKNKRFLRVPVQTIANGVNVQRFSAGSIEIIDVRTALNIPKEALVVGTIAVFRFQKRLDLWLDIAKGILEKLPGVHFVIVGDGPLKDELLRKRKELGLDKSVHMVGLQSEVRPYLAALDLYLMTSVYEGLPIALLEAMASGKAVLTTDAGGIKELVRHKFDGWMVKVQESETLLPNAINLLTDKDERDRLGQNARQRVIDQFSMDKMVKELEELYSMSVKKSRF